jgi:hypothetical protein
MVWVQQVDILYTKASRGAPQATERNRLPRAFALRSAGGHAFYFEHYKLLEAKDFTANLEECLNATAPPHRQSDLVMELAENGLTLGLIWNNLIGQPRRRDKPRAITIKSGQTARLSINGRYTSYSGQIYTEATYNVAFGDTISTDVFIKGEPDSVFDLRADLF